MVWNSSLYGVFTVLVFLTYWFIVPAALRSAVLLAASCGLLFALFPAPSLLILAVATVVYLAGEWIDSGQTGWKAVFFLTVLGVLGVLAYYKYFPLAVQTYNDIGRWAGSPVRYAVPEIIIPVGVSFFTFRFIHYLVEVKRGAIESRSYFRFLLYTFFFPIITAGPIERYNRFESQRAEIKGFKWEYAAEGLPRIILGLFKKIVIADSIALLSAELSKPGLNDVAYLVAVYSYAFKIFFDFSGYSDIAIGTGRLFGFQVMENFNAPYLQRNISLFWKGWHMSLTGWFRDYLFIPLGGSRGKPARTVVNTLIVMAATGFWHGAAWHFMFWGLYHAVGLLIYRFYNLLVGARLSDRFKNSWPVRALSVALTFNFAAFGWVFFVNDFAQGMNVLKIIFHI
ncbi:MBOAT family O-acyltransferase [Pelotomaculum propionicicum]|uniref:Peptidoglycan O-acetyltransferase n=1 Tax=Pelotomaculum propionicicum TaxID=258475 RepID=A0A4Y7RNM9_9FIRM|nr:MBOAT family O-acyltransferase [Pelotomaculum propionicicum]NLI12334.1 MBOAT family protein [Peptococcaceae bacterium]TEB10463.1 Peptidoglycan O-acetyltransferase [Pelotomaculum propionicicum]